MDKYRYSDDELSFMEKSSISFAVYQFINKRVVTIVLSRGFCELFGFEDKAEAYELMDNNMYRDTHPDDLAELGDAAYRFATEGGSYDVVYRSLRDGEYRIIHAYGKHIYKEDGTRLAVIWYSDKGAYHSDSESDKDRLLADIRTELEHRSIGRRENHDYLTGLPSMTYFFELAEAGCNEMRKNGEKPAILFFDFNGMKSYNQKYGLAEGDKLLVKFKDILVKYYTHENCSRFSADHFCVFSEASMGLDAAQKILDECAHITNGKALMPLRVGFYNYMQESISVSGACDRAKIACDSGRKNYDSKIYLFSEEMMEGLLRRQYVVENIDKAIANKWVKAYFQPIVRSANGRVCAEEALARWNDPEKGFLSPADFIPALEESNAIYKLDLYMVDCILEKIGKQKETSLYLVPHSVNLSRSDFYACDIVEEIRKRVDSYGIDRSLLVVEITESAIADDIEYMTTKIKQFKELGFTVWMDDYGSGYSSPGILQKIPFDLIKIDMLFVRLMNESEKGKIILTEIVKMALSIGLDTIAEGVETKEQMDFLKDIGCSMLQGFYFCKAVSLDEIIDRNEKNIQIGYENPSEADYYDHLGKISLYNLSSREDDDSLKNYFDIWPMVILECYDEKVSFVRCNAIFRQFFYGSYPDKKGKSQQSISELKDKPGFYALKAILQCGKDGKRVIVDDVTMDGKLVQLLISRAAVNPVTGVSAVVIAVLSVSEAPADKGDASQQ